MCRSEIDGTGHQTVCNGSDTRRGDPVQRLRPGFQKMIEDIDLGYISTVIVKDLSRLGRRYDTVGYYTDTYFPDRDVRFIAINDNVDSDEGENEIAPFKNIINEWYAKDISKKCRSSYRIRGSTGEPLSQPPYGYMKAPDNKKK